MESLQRSFEKWYVSHSFSGYRIAVRDLSYQWRWEEATEMIAIQCHLEWSCQQHRILDRLTNSLMESKPRYSHCKKCIPSFYP